MGLPAASCTTTTSGLDAALFWRTICPLPETMERVAWPKADPASTSNPIRDRANFFEEENMSSLHEILIRYWAGAGTCDYQGRRTRKRYCSTACRPREVQLQNKKKGG